MWRSPRYDATCAKRKIELAIGSRARRSFRSPTLGVREAQVDWYEAYADIGGEREKAYVFCLRSMASGGAFHRAYPHASQQAFLEAHELAFRLFWWRVSVLALRQPEECSEEDSARTPARRDHAIHCLPIALGFRSRSSARQEKGTRRAAWKEKADTFGGTIWCRCRRWRSWEELNLLLLEASRKDEQRMIGERAQTVGAGMILEREHLLPLAEEGFDLAAIHFPQVNASGCVKVLTNFYSAPSAGRQSKCRPRSIRPTWRSGTRESAWRGMSAASTGSRRCSTWSTTWTR